MFASHRSRLEAREASRTLTVFGEAYCAGFLTVMMSRGRPTMPLPPPGAVTAGMLPSAAGDRFVMVMGFDRIGAGRNIGAIGVRQPQYLSSFPRKRFSRSFWESIRTCGGGAAVVENVSRPPATSLSLLDSPTVVLELRTPSMWRNENLKSPLSFCARRTPFGSHQYTGAFPSRCNSSLWRSGRYRIEYPLFVTF